MIVIDISKYVVPTRRDSNNGLSEIVDWLNDNVGVWDENVFNRTSHFVREGVGWSIRTHRNGVEEDRDNPSGYAVITWHAYIEDEQKATLFALKWVN